MYHRQTQNNKTYSVYSQIVIKSGLLALISSSVPSGEKHVCTLYHQEKLEEQISS